MTMKIDLTLTIGWNSQNFSLLHRESSRYIRFSFVVARNFDYTTSLLDIFDSYLNFWK